MSQTVAVQAGGSVSRKSKEQAFDTALYTAIALLQGLQAVERIDWKSVSGVLVVGLIALKAKRSKGIENEEENGRTN
jgi:hypothetical protein